MLHWLPGPLNGLFSLTWLSANTLFWFVPLLVAAFFKWIIPLPQWRRGCDRVLNRIAQSWVALNNVGLALTKRIRWKIHGVRDLKEKGWYLVLANHQSWTDIVVLQKVFHRRLPFLKFFLKKELIYVPFLGLAWWALDFPFMKRSSAAAAQKKPNVRARDVAETLKACEKFKHVPIAVMNFAEGTRATVSKILEKGSPYTHLLRPKAAGAAMVLATMKERLHGIVDVTLVYPEGPVSFWRFLCGKVREIWVHVETLPVRPELLGDYFQDKAFQKRFQDWLNELWEAKDRRIEAMKREWREMTCGQESPVCFPLSEDWDRSRA